MSLPPIQSFLKDIFTGKDGESFDLGRLLWAGTAIWAPALQTFDVVANHVRFDIQAFGVGMGVILAGGGGALALKRKTEPDAADP